MTILQQHGHANGSLPGGGGVQPNNQVAVRVGANIGEGGWITPMEPMRASRRSRAPQIPLCRYGQMTPTHPEALEEEDDVGEVRALHLGDRVGQELHLVLGPGCGKRPALGEGGASGGDPAARGGIANVNLRVD